MSWRVGRQVRTPNQRRCAQGGQVTRAAGGGRGPGPLVAAVVLILAAGCGGPGENVDAGGRGPSGTEVAQEAPPPEPTDDGVGPGPTDDPPPPPNCEGALDVALPAPPAPPETLGAPSAKGYEVIGEGLEAAPAGGSATFDLHFEGVENALLWIFPGDEGISPSLEGAEFAREELLGAGLVAGVVASPADGQMVVHNDTGQSEDIVVIVFGLTARRLSVETSPDETAPNEEVTITILLSEATATDRPCASVSRDGVPIASLDLQPDGVGVWRSSFRPDSAGSYAFGAMVGGERPRRVSSLAFVQVR